MTAGGFEPLVGEIRVVRTFRIGPAGELLPLYGDEAWRPGVNTARCRSGEGHRVVDPGCSCGFYGYAHVAAAAQYAHTEHVLAVVSCWGRVVAGTRGLRAQYARIDGVWLSDRVPRDLATRIGAAYPGARVHADRAGLLADHPPSVLEGWDPAPHHPRSRWLQRGAVGAAVVVGLLPIGTLGLVAAALACVVVAWVARPRTGEPATGRVGLTGALVLWLLAPLGGVLGVLLLRVPLVVVVALGAVARQRERRAAATFPAPGT